MIMMVRKLSRTFQAGGRGGELTSTRTVIRHRSACLWNSSYTKLHFFSSYKRWSRLGAAGPGVAVHTHTFTHVYTHIQHDRTYNSTYSHAELPSSGKKHSENKWKLPVCRPKQSSGDAYVQWSGGIGSSLKEQTCLWPERSAGYWVESELNPLSVKQRGENVRPVPKQAETAYWRAPLRMRRLCRGEEGWMRD